MAEADKSWRVLVNPSRIRRMFAYALTIFLGAFLLFLVQPLIGKYILPWFGGGPGVWTTCMLFFQVLLLGGYAYAHLLSRRFKPRAQGIVHGVLLLAALLFLPVTPSDAWKPRGNGDPVTEILLLLGVCLGLPYFILSATGPLLQQWFSRTNPGVSPYRLYALSNIGSLLALVSYPFLIETNLTRLAQARFWGWGFAAFVICCGYCALLLVRAKPVVETSGKPQRGKPAEVARVTRRVWGLWLLLPACASILLLATTNKLCQDIAVMPFLWVLPLAIYLLSFIISFDNPRWYQRTLFAIAMVVALPAVCWALFMETDLSLGWQVGVYTGALFVCCMVCHGELYRLRPDPSQLTGFYLMIAAGGALGGLFVAVIAPLIFADYYELHWALLLCGALFTSICAMDRQSAATGQWRWLAGVLTLGMVVGVDALLAWSGRKYPDLLGDRVPLMRVAWWAAMGLLVVLWLARRQHRNFQHWRFLACFWLTVGLVVLGTALWFQARDFGERVVARSRNFYGTLKVCEYHKEDPEEHYLLLEHGRITHGLQFLHPDYAKWPTTYYSDESGLALATRALPAGPRRIGVVGLGTGTMAVFGRKGDYLRIYEINPQVVQIASSRFTYLSNCPAQVEIALGDARLSLEHESPQGFDLLALDAFSSDAIPVHLLTQEAFELYSRHLNTNGVIAVHISNRYLDLQPVIRNLAREFNLKLAIIDYEEEGEDEDGNGAWWNYSSTWALLTHNDTIINHPSIRAAGKPTDTNATAVPLWTDDFASIFQILE